MSSSLLRKAVVLATLTGGGVLLSAQAPPRLAFIGVALDAGTRQADHRLTEYLGEKAGIRFVQEELEYGQVIRRLVDWRPGDDVFVARITPYAYVAAELLGASVEPLATYVSSATGQTTNRAYFVVSRAAFPSPPELPDLVRLLTSRRRHTFVYHNEFSTSSYFLPSLFFRANRIFNMAESTERLTAIGAEKLTGASSAALVEQVARGDADVAAVWDGVKARFESDPALMAVGRRVYFVALPTPIPNDLLVCASAVSADTKARLHEALKAMSPSEIDVGDFRTWRSLSDAGNARLALGDLRQAARSQAARVLVDIRPSPAAPPAVLPLLEAARQAVRLSETEFQLFDDDFHGQPDFRWTIEPIHDGAVVLHSAIPGYDVAEQVFQISFRDDHDLTARIVSLVQSRLHRIRNVWPYSGSAPVILRDSSFVLPEGTPVKVQRITWIDPDRNQFQAGEVFGSRIERASFYRYELAAEDFSRPAAGVRPDPMSNASYRVILVRPADRPWAFRILTLALVACFVIAGASAAWTLWRAPARPASSPSGRRT